MNESIHVGLGAAFLLRTKVSMTSTLPPTRSHSGTSGITSRLIRSVEASQEIDLQEWLMNFWSGRYLIIGCVLITVILGSIYTWYSVPVYQSEALLQIDPPKTIRDSDMAFARMGDLFSTPFEANTEIEILGSNLVLGETVKAQHLDIIAQPVLRPFIGEALVRGKPDAPLAEVEVFELPESMRGVVFQITALPDGSFSWKSPLIPPVQSGKPGATFLPEIVLAAGRPGDLLVAIYGGETLKLQLRRLIAKPGQVFRLVKQPMSAAIQDLRNNLEAAEKGVSSANRPTNLLAITLRNSNPTRAAEILNEVMNQYIFQNTKRKSEEIAQTLAQLNKQLPEIHSRLVLAENNLNRFRTQTGAVDIPREVDLALQQTSGLETQISGLKQKKEELCRIYQEDSDVVKTLNAQIAKLEAESATLNQKVKTLPSAQQELVRLSRDVQVNTELYTAMLNNIQQLQVTQEGKGRNCRVVDYAMPSLRPIKPKKEMLLGVSVVMGLFLGVLLVLGRRTLRQGIEDHRIIESKLGLTVLVTIPHSKAQTGHDKAMNRRSPGNHLLALHDPEDLAIESLRSLRTTLDFSLGSGSSRSIVITGPSPKIGKSFVIANFSVLLAQAGVQVLLVDGDMRRGNLHSYFGLKNRLGGLSEVITGLCPWKSVLHMTEVPGLQVMSSGEIPKNPAELLTAPSFTTFLAEACAEYQYVIIDAPPLLPVADAAIIGSKVDTVLLVAKFGQHSLDELRTCQSRIEASGLHLMGCIFNDLMPTGLGDQDYRYAYHYQYGKAGHS